MNFSNVKKPVSKTAEKSRRIYSFKIFLIVFLVVSLNDLPLAAAAAAQDMETPVDVQFPLLFKILTYDRNLVKRVGEEIVFGIIYQEKFRKSFNVKIGVDNFLRNWSNTDSRIENIPCRFVFLNLSSPAELRTWLAREKVDVIYVTPLRAFPLDSLAAICRSAGITSFTGVPEYCEAGISLSIGSRGESPLIIVNLEGSQQEGADFSSKLLKLAKVIDNK